MKRLVTISSGKGGVGKTWFAISLSHALHLLGYRILLIDADVGLANINVQLGLKKGCDLGARLGNGKAILSSIQKAQMLGFDVLLGQSSGACMGALDLSAAELILNELRTLYEDYDLIVLDLPSGNDLGMRRLMTAADDSVLLTTEEPTALTDAYALIKTARKKLPNFIPKIVINFVGSHQAGNRTFEGLSRVCDRFMTMRPAFLGSIRRDRRVAEAISRQAPLFQCYPKCDAAADVMALATTLIGQAPLRLP